MLIIFDGGGIIYNIYVIFAGTCQPYKQEGDHCGGGFEVANGYCGCAPGLTCYAILESSMGTGHLQVLGKREAVRRSPLPPGYVTQCLNATTPTERVSP